MGQESTLSNDESKVLVGLKRLTTKESTVVTAAYTSYTAAVIVSPEDANNSGTSIFNNTDTDDLYVLVGDGIVSPTNFTCKIEIDALYETPFLFAGNVSIIQVGATTGNIAVTIHK